MSDADSSSYNAYGFWPSAGQERLLEASLFEGDGARSAFAAWQSDLDIETLDGGSVRLLPLLYQNMVDQQIDANSRLLDRLRGVYRHSWYKNQLLVAAVGGVLRAFEQAGVPAIVLKGVPLGLSYYPKLGMRPMLDADILIPHDVADRGFHAALAAGLTPRFPDGEWPPRLIASKAFAHRDGWEFDLHVNVMHECRGPDADRDMWEAAVPISVGGAETLTLSPEDHVLHVLAHGVWRNPLSPIRWIPDAVMVLRREGPRFDWIRLWQQARSRRMLLVVARALGYLRERMRVEVPVEVVSRFESATIGLAERFEYQSRMMPGAAGLAACRVTDYLRARGRDREWQGPLGFVRYVRDSWGLDSTWRVPAAAGRKTMRRLKEQLKP